MTIQRGYDITQADMGGEPGEAEPLDEDAQEVYDAELMAAAYGPLPDARTAAEWARDEAMDFAAAWDTTIPLAPFDEVPF